MIYTYKCINYGKAFKASGSRVHYNCFSPKIFIDYLEIAKYIFQPSWYLCDDCFLRRKYRD